MLRFRWTSKTSAAAVALAEGKTRQQVADEIGSARMTLWRWLQDTEFAAEVDRLSLAIDIAVRAARMRIAMRAVRKLRDADGTLHTNKDVLDWLKFAQSETARVTLDQQALAEAVAACSRGLSPVETS